MSEEIKPKEFKCTLCGAILDGAYALHKHRQVNHKDRLRKYNAKQNTQPGTMAKFMKGEEFIKEALREVDAERDQLHKKVLELDDIAAKYRKVLNPNTK